MDQGAIFKSNRSQAVRLPKSVAFPADVTRVDVVVIGRARLITSAGQSWDTWFDGNDADPTFMVDREQPAEQERDSF